MDTNNPLQQRTGQVAPTAQSPQSAPLQPFQQSEGLQNTSSQLLDGDSNLTISVPANNGTVSSSQAQPKALQHDSFGLVVIIAVLLVVIAIATSLFLLQKKAIMNEPEPESEPEVDVEVEVEVEPVPEVVEKPKPKPKPKKSGKKKKSKSKKKR